jgi:hypothetical protein
MGVTTLKKDDFVKWPIQGGFGFGQIVDVLEKGGLATIKLPSDSVLEKEVKTLVAVQEKEFETALSDLIGTLQSKSKTHLTKACEDKTMATELETVKAELAKLQAELTKAQEALESAKKKEKDMQDEASLYNEKLSKVEDMRKQADEARLKVQAQLDEITKARKTEARIAEIKGLKALASIDADEAKAADKLSTMSDDTYNAVRDMAKAFDKITNVTQSTQPKATDQSQTSLTKVTDAKKDEKDDKKKDDDTDAAKALKEAEAEKDKDLASKAASAAAQSSEKAPNSLTAAFAKMFNTNVEKDSK